MTHRTGLIVTILAGLLLLASGLILIRLGRVLDAVNGTDLDLYGQSIQSVVPGCADLIYTERLRGDTVPEWLDKHRLALELAQD